MSCVLNKIPLIFLAYLSVILYFLIFNFNLICLILFIFSSLLALYRKYYLVIPFLLVMGSFFLVVKMDTIKNSENQPTTLSKITMIPDTIQVNGDLLSFQGKERGQNYQVYETLKSKKEQKFYQNLSQNCQLSFTGNLQIPEKQRNFNGFDNQKYLASQNIYRQITIDKINKIVLNDTFDLHVLRRKAIVWSQTHFPKPMNDYMTGLLFGFLSKDFNQIGDIYSSLGIIHLFALSGMQVNFFIDWFRRIILRLGITREKLNIWQIPFSIFYAFMTGFSVSVLRALFQKNIRLNPLDNLAVTTFLLMIVSPKFLLTTGGQLTLFYAFVISMINHKFSELKGIRKLLTESSVISLSVLPLLILDFHIFQPFSILLTIGFGFLFDVILLPLLLGTFLLSLIGYNFNINHIFQILEWLIHEVDLPLHYPLVLGNPRPIELLILFFLIGLLIDNLFKKRRQIIFAGLIVCSFFICKNPVYPSITAVDIGQGDSIFLQDKFNKETILIDTGGRLALPQESWQKPQSQTNAEKTLIPYLESVGVSQIDQLILTHTDADHVGDFLNLADKIKIKEIWVSPGELTNNHFVEKLKKANIAIHISKVGDKIPIFDSALQVLSNGYTGKGDNNDSIVTYGNFYHTKFLFTGDLEQEGEKELLKNYPKLKVDVLKVGHHGSKTSSNPDFIKEINPKLALISVGEKNRYGHPNQETLETLKKNQIRILRTDQKGALKLMQINQQWRIQTVR